MSVNKVNQTTGELSPIAGGTLYADMAVGSIVPFGGTVIPDNFLLCDGQSLLRTDYPELFAVIGTSFGSVDSTHFNVPDLRESTVKGAGLTGNSSNHLDSDGLTVGEFIDDRVQDHTHNITNNVQNYSSVGTNIYLGSGSSTVTYGGTYYTNEIRSGRKGNTTEVKAVGVNFIIKAKKVGIPTDFKDAIQDSYSTEEVKTNKTWIDGKPIYRKVIEKTVTLTGNSWVSTSIDVSEIDTLCNCTMLSNKFAFGGFYTRKTSNQLDVYCVSNANWSINTFILEYTKTTD